MSVSETNTDLKAGFLVHVMNFLNVESNRLKFRTHYSGSIVYDDVSDMENNKITYNEEDFYIINIDISNFGVIVPMDTYKAKWSNCYGSDTPLPYGCDCENESTDSTTEHDPDVRFLLEGETINDKIISVVDAITSALSDDTIEKRYSSQPKEHTCISGNQFRWLTTFEYLQPNIYIKVNLGKKQVLTGKRVHWQSSTEYTGRIVTSYTNETVYSYMPNNMCFDYDIYPVLKSALVHDIDIITYPPDSAEYESKSYKIVDYKFCKVYSADYFCGCFRGKCVDRPKEWAIENFPSDGSYRYNLYVSCTPERYIQLMIGSCGQYSNCFRFILKPIN
jgi:hypothetical protein